MEVLVLFMYCISTSLLRFISSVGGNNLQSDKLLLFKLLLSVTEGRHKSRLNLIY